jgi:transcriptional regulator with XRE-family HTH domain
MRSLKTTTVAVLRTMLGLSIDEFGELIGKAPSTIKSLESGRLALSHDTAIEISLQTGVALEWLLNGNPKKSPVVITSPNGAQEPYSKEHFERIQAKRQKPAPLTAPEDRIWPALVNVTDWLSVYHHAVDTGKADLVRYLMQKFLDDLVTRFGKDDAAFLEANTKTRIVTARGSQLEFIRHGNGNCVVLCFADPES